MNVRENYITLFHNRLKEDATLMKKQEVWGTRIVTGLSLTALALYMHSLDALDIVGGVVALPAGNALKTSGFSSGVHLDKMQKGFHLTDTLIVEQTRQPDFLYLAAYGLHKDIAHASSLEMAAAQVRVANTFLYDTLGRHKGLEKHAQYMRSMVKTHATENFLR